MRGSETKGWVCVMDVKCTVDGGVATLYVSGWLDTPNAPKLAQALSNLGPDVKKMVMDLSKLDYISSAGIRQLVFAQRQVQGALTLRHPSPEVKEVLDLVGLTKALNIED